MVIRMGWKVEFHWEDGELMIFNSCDDINGIYLPISVAEKIYEGYAKHQKDDGGKNV